MIKLFNDPNFLLEIFYDYNAEVDGSARDDDLKRDEFNEISEKFKNEYQMARQLQKDKAAMIRKKINKVTLQIPACPVSTRFC